MIETRRPSALNVIKEYHDNLHPLSYGNWLECPDITCVVLRQIERRQFVLS